jgi:hypothetical protein
MPEPIAPTASITITLQAQEWNQLLTVLAQGPYNIVAPLMTSITQQAQSGASQPSLPLNGHDDHPRAAA